MKKSLFIIVLAVLTLASCGEYQKALKSEDTAVKFKTADSLFNAGKYAKANRLFVQIVPNYRGKPQAEKLMYMYSKTFYEMKDYYLAGYQFERFTKAYPNSEKLSEAAFLSAKSKYKLSPVFTKDQSETKEAINKLQLFINSYPDSPHIEEANSLVQELDFKLENKAFTTAKQYNTISDFKASIKSFDNFVLNYPGSKLREEALYLRLDSAFKLAVNSVPWKKEDRLNTAKSYYQGFKKKYPSSGYSTEVDKMMTDLEKELQAYNTKS